MLMPRDPCLRHQQRAPHPLSGKSHPHPQAPESHPPQYPRTRHRRSRELHHRPCHLRRPPRCHPHLRHLHQPPPLDRRRPQHGLNHPHHRPPPLQAATTLPRVSQSRPPSGQPPAPSPLLQHHRPRRPLLRPSSPRDQRRQALPTRRPPLPHRLPPPRPRASRLPRSRVPVRHPLLRDRCSTRAASRWHPTAAAAAPRHPARRGTHPAWRQRREETTMWCRTAGGSLLPRISSPSRGSLSAGRRNTAPEEGAVCRWI